MLTRENKNRIVAQLCAAAARQFYAHFLHQFGRICTVASGLCRLCGFRGGGESILAVLVLWSRTGGRGLVAIVLVELVGAETLALGLLPVLRVILVCGVVGVVRVVFFHHFSRSFE